MKRTIAIIMALALTFCIFGCAERSRTFDIRGAASLVIISGSNGESVTVTDPDDIKSVTDNICGLSYSRDGKVNTDGWSYLLKWLDKDGKTIEVLVVLGNNKLSYDGHYYDANSGAKGIDLELIGSVFARGN